MVLGCSRSILRAFAILALAGIAPFTPDAGGTPPEVTGDNDRMVWWLLLPAAEPRGLTAICLSQDEVREPRVQVTRNGSRAILVEREMQAFRTPHPYLWGDFSYGGFVNELDPDTRYRVRCGAEGRWSQWREIETASPAARYAPSSRPDRIILTWSQDPSASQSVGWRTDSSVDKAQAEITLAASSLDFAMHARRSTALTHRVDSPEFGTVLQHEVHFTGLRPDTVYAYRVGEQGGEWSEWFQFRTASQTSDPFRFIYFGDAQNEIRQDFSRLFRQALLSASDARFFLYAGDLVDMGDNDAQWGQWHAAGGWANASIATVPVIGNHEYFLTRFDGLVAQQAPIAWRANFALPMNGPEGMEERVYYLDYQGLRLIVLDSVLAEPQVFADRSNDAQRQARWLEDVLSDNPNRWTIVSFHYPLISTYDPEGSNRMRSHWQLLFEKYGVDLVLQAHSHLYTRMRVDSRVDPHDFRAASGPVYLQSVAGGPPLGLGSADVTRFQKAGAGERLYQVISVEGDKLVVEALRPSGTRFDGFVLTKDQPDRAAVMTELAGEEDGVEAIVPPSPDAPAVTLNKLTGRFGLRSTSSWSYADVRLVAGRLELTLPHSGLPGPGARREQIILVQGDKTLFSGHTGKGEAIEARFLLDDAGHAVRMKIVRRPQEANLYTGLPEIYESIGPLE